LNLLERIHYMAISFKSGSRLLFIGDSITDCGRREDREEMGSGYPRLIRDWLTAKDPTDAPHVINRGISGNKVTDLADRWTSDVIAEKPDVVSVKVGINDVWHGLAPRTAGVPIGDFVATYRRLLTETQKALPNIGLVLCQPSVIWHPAPAEGNETLKPYIAAVNELAKEFRATLVPLHEAFTRAARLRPDIKWTPDGVHPSSPGHMLIARTWLVATGLI
jgi:acyl-CoA thioesterase I